MIRLQRLAPRNHTQLKSYIPAFGKSTCSSFAFRALATSASQIPTLRNMLGSSQSPFLKAQASSPVAWQEWSPEILDLAASFNKPIFLSIGYLSSYWSQVMAHESFNDPEVAKLINANFVPIKLDRDERRDIDLLYTMYYEATTGQSGWPLNVFLDPSTLAPFFGGMYWPSAAAVASAEKSQGNNSGQSPAPFEAVLTSVSGAWETSQDKCVGSAQAIRDRLRELHRLQNGAEKADLKLSVLDDVWDHYSTSFDANFGGFSQSPKFLCPHNLSFLLKYSDLVTPPLEKRQQSQQWTKSHGLDAKEMASFTLEKIGGGAIKDQVGKGFHHYSVTDDWSLPHFEKLLVDQALLLSSYIYAYQVDPEKNAFALEFVKDLVSYMSTSTAEKGLQTNDGGLITSVNSDSKPIETAYKRDNDELETVASMNTYGKVEGAYYVWQYDDFEKALTRTESDILGAYFNVREHGNINEEFDVHHKLAYQNTLYRSMDTTELSRYFGMSKSKIQQIIDKASAKLRVHRRETREHPEIDRRVFVGWNGAAINALAHTAIAFLRPSVEQRQHDLAILGQKALDTAKTIAHFIHDKMFDEETGSLQRYYLDGAVSKTPAMNDDYAYLIQGLISLYTATFDTFYLDFAKTLQDAQLMKFWDMENGGFYFSDSKLAAESRLFLRFKHSFDSAEPSSNGVSAENLFKLSGLLHDSFYRDKAVDILQCYGKDITAQPFGYCSMLNSVAAFLRSSSSSGTLTSVIVVGGEAEDALPEDTLPETELHQIRQQLFDIFAQGKNVEESEKPADDVFRVPSLVPNLTILRLRQADIDNYFEPYGVKYALYGALVDKYGQGPVKYIISRNFTCLDPVSSLEEVVSVVFKNK